MLKRSHFISGLAAGLASLSGLAAEAAPAVSRAEPPARPTVTTDIQTAHPVNNIATFTVASTGNPHPTVRWQRSVDAEFQWQDVPASAGTVSTQTVNGVTSSSLRINLGTSPGARDYMYRALFTNSLGQVSTGWAYIG